MKTKPYQSCIDACIACAVECDNCATACLQDEDVSMMLRCVNLNRLCAEACYAAARLMTISPQHAAEFCLACAKLCDECAAECRKHAEHGIEHCKACHEICTRCATACRAMAANI